MEQASPASQAFHYRLRLAYKGTNFHGWQTQTADCEAAQEDSFPTVQGTILRALRKVARYGDCSIAGTSRTDAGVHAQGQVAKVSLPRELPSDILHQGLNSMLPASIRVIDCSPCPREFNPQLGATSKEYHYYFFLDPVGDPLLSDVVAHIPGPMDLDAMRRAAQVFVGRHDFSGFCRRSTKAATTVREIYECELVEPSSGVLAQRTFTIRIVGNGFLKQMVRYMVSALCEVGRGRVSLQALREQLEHRGDDKLAPKAPAHGLHLYRIHGL